jgi:hypothetical protein
MGTFATDDLDTAVAFYESIDDENAKRLFDDLIDHPDEQRTAAELQQHLGFAEHRDVARATFRLGNLAAAHGRARPWAESQIGYRMPGQMAVLFKRAREHKA